MTAEGEPEGAARFTDPQTMLSPSTSPTAEGAALRAGVYAAESVSANETPLPTCAGSGEILSPLPASALRGKAANGRGGEGAQGAYGAHSTDTLGRPQLVTQRAVQWASDVGTAAEAPPGLTRTSSIPGKISLGTVLRLRSKAKAARARARSQSARRAPNERRISIDIRRQINSRKSGNGHRHHHLSHGNSSFTLGSGQAGLAAAASLRDCTAGQLEFRPSSQRKLVKRDAMSVIEARQAKFIRLQTVSTSFAKMTSEQQIQRTATLQQLVHYMKSSWNMKMPSVIFAVTGSAAPFDLRPKHRELFTSALLQATQSTNAWIVTGGTSAGIMKLIGDSLSGNRVDTALGITTWGIVHGRDDLIDYGDSERAADNLERELHGSLRICTVEIYDIPDQFAYVDKLVGLYQRFGAVLGVSFSDNLPRYRRHEEKRHRISQAKELSPSGRIRTGSSDDESNEAAQGSSADRDSVWYTTSSAGTLMAKAQRRQSVALGKGEFVSPTPNSKAGRVSRWALLSFKSPVAAQNCINGTVEVRMGGGKKYVLKHRPPKVNAIWETADSALPLEQKPQESKEQWDSRHLWYFHKRSCIKSRGSVALPYVYQPHLSGEADPSKGTAELDRNHSHYLLLDDGSEGKFGHEVAFRGELLDFISFRYDASTLDVLQLRDEIRSRDANRKRSVPVICLVGGGGPNTLDTIMGHIVSNDPVIIMRDSGRVCDLITSWKATVGSGSVEKQTSLCRSWALDQPGASFPTTKEAEQELQEQVQNVKKVLTTIVSYPQLHFFDFSNNVDSSIGKNLDGLLLPTVLKSIFQSMTVEERVKLPLAIRFDDATEVKRVLKHQGLMKKSAAHADELSSDSRPLLYAAYHDQADVVRELLDAGFGPDQIDHIILLEVTQMVEQHALRKGAPLDPPRFWIESRGGKTIESRGGNFKRSDSALDLDALTVAQQTTKLTQEWLDLTPDTRLKLISDESRRVTWRKLPWITGWTYRVTGRILVSQDGDAMDDGKADELVPGDTLKQIGVRRDPAAQTIFVTLVADNDSKNIYEAEVISAERARKETQLNPQAARDSLPQWTKYTWLLINTHATGRIMLQQERYDEISRSLELDEQGKWERMRMTDELYKSTMEAFSPWIDLASINVGDMWWDDNKWQIGHQIYDVLDTQRGGLDPLLRLYWAVVTKRDKLAEYLWHSHSDTPFVSSFMASYVCRHLVTPGQTTKFGGRSSIDPSTLLWDQKSIRLLQHFSDNCRAESVTALFDEYVFFGKEEERQVADGVLTYYSMLSKEQDVANRKIRSALALMDCDAETPKTRIDLAIRAENKQFMGHKSTEAFLDMMWCRKGGNGEFCDTLMNATPKQKWYCNSIGYCLFVGFFMYIYFDLPFAASSLGTTGVRDDRAGWQHKDGWQQGPTLSEWFFWFYVLAQCVYELHQYFEDFDNFFEYLKGSGNKLDFTINFCFGIALICRISSWMMAARYKQTNGVDQLDGNELCKISSACLVYTFTSVMFMINSFLCFLRIMSMLNVFRQLGVLMIIVTRIIVQDVAPFLILLLFFIVNFEVTAKWFYWMLEVDSTAVVSWSYLYALSEQVDNLRFESELSEAKFENSLHYAMSVDDGTNRSLIWVKFLYDTLFFVIAVIVLLNLLIAMMSDTYNRVTGTATEVWRLEFARQVREYFDATVLPPPFNMVELAVNKCMIRRRDAARHRFESGRPSLTWGQHYIWPISSLDTDLRGAKAAFYMGMKSEDPTQWTVDSILARIEPTSAEMQKDIRQIASMVAANKSWDTTGDGQANVFDMAGDGKADAWDTTGDGRIDAIDSTGDGRIDHVSADSNLRLAQPTTTVNPGIRADIRPATKMAL